MVFERPPEGPGGHAFSIHHFRGGRAFRALLGAFLGDLPGVMADARAQGSGDAFEFARSAGGELCRYSPEARSTRARDGAAGLPSIPSARFNVRGLFTTAQSVSPPGTRAFVIATTRPASTGGPGRLVALRRGPGSKRSSMTMRLPSRRTTLPLRVPRNFRNSPAGFIKRTRGSFHNSKMASSGQAMISRWSMTREAQ